MEVRLSTGTQGNDNISKEGRVDPKELTPETYEYYCRLYLIDSIYTANNFTNIIKYGSIAKIINSVDSILFKNLHLETNKILLLNKIYSLFMEILNEEISRSFLYNKIIHIARYDPILYQERDK